MADTEGIRVPWPGWSVTRRLGSGGFGSVYEIERDIFGRKEKAAMKVVSIPESQSELDSDYSDGYDDESITEKYQNELQKVMGEYQLMAEMKGHSNLVSCDDYAVVEHTGMIGWDVYIRMELLTPLHAVLRNGDFSVEKVCRLGADICRALTVCERKNIIHRDIKPENILVSENGDFKLGDFGIARTMDHTTHATKTGTDRYMAPEVLKGEKYGKTVDIYSLGLVLYWLLNRRRMPFLPLNTAPTADETGRSRARRLAGEALPKPADGNEALKQMVLKACAYRPGDRFADAQSMLNALEAAKAGQTFQAVQTGSVSGAGYSANMAGFQEDYERTIPPDSYAGGAFGSDDSSGKSRGNGWADDNDEVSRPGNAWGRIEAEDKAEKTMPAERPKKPAAQQADDAAGEQSEPGEKWIQLLKRAEQGDAEAQCIAGQCYWLGYCKSGETVYFFADDGFQRNEEEAEKWYRKAAEQDFASGQSALGSCYFEGRGVAQNYEEAVKWYQKAAAQGDASAMYNIGKCRQHGYGISRNYEEAVNWYRNAAMRGDVRAQYLLGVAYRYGCGIEKNEKKAELWERTTKESKRELDMWMSILTKEADDLRTAGA